MRVTTVLRTTEESTAASGYQVSASKDRCASTCVGGGFLRAKDFHPRPFGPKLLSSVGLGPIRPPVPRNCLKLPQSNISGVLAVMHFSDFSAKSVHSPRPPGAVSPARAARDFFALRPLKTLVFNAFQCTSHHVYEPWDPSLTHLICHPHEHSSEERARNTQVLL